MNTYYAYLARCCDNSLYAGYTNDIQNRETVHNEGNECALKKLTKPQKEDLVASGIVIAKAKDN